MRVIFRRSDAVAEQHGECEDIELTTVEHVQMTYHDMRDTDQGDTIAHVDSNGLWWTNEHGPFSDVVVLPDN